MGSPAGGLTARSSPCQRAGGGSRGAGECYLGEQSGRRHLVAGKENSVAAVNSGTVAPSGAGQIYGAREVLQLHAPPPNLTLAPIGESSVEHRLQALHALLERLAGRQAAVALDQFVARRSERGVGRGEALDPATAV